MSRLLWHGALYVLLVSTAFIAMGLISLPPTNMTTVWLPAGVALALMVFRLGWWALPTIWLANTSVVYLANGYPLFSWHPFTYMLALVNTAGPALSYAVWRWWLTKPPFEDGRSYIKFVFGVALVPSLLTAWMVIAIIKWAGFLAGMTWDGFLIRSGINTLSSSLGILLVLPLVLAPRDEGLGRSAGEIGAAHGLNLLLTLLVCWLSFHVTPYAIYLTIPLAMLAALLTGARGVAIAVMLIAFYGLIATAHGLGPFVLPAEDTRTYRPVFEMAIFAFCLSLPGQFAGIVYDQLRRYQAGLEDMVAQRTRDLSEAEERFRLAIEAVSDGIFDWEFRRSKPRFNPSFFTMLGHPADTPDPDWQTLRRFVHPRDRERVDTVISECRAAQRDSFQVEARVRVRGGGWQWILARGRVVLRGDDGAAQRLVGTTTDITEERQRTSELVSARNRAQQADRAKSQFLAAMSHEIRTPMNGVLGFAEMLDTTDLNQTQQEFVESIRTSGETLLALLNDILDLSKIEAGHMDLEQRAFDLSLCIESVVQLFRMQSEAKHVPIRVVLAEGLPEMVVGDSTRLKQVLSNLVSNAMKFTEVGSVTIEVEESDAGNPNYHDISIAVKDTGIGIAPEVQARLFRPFSQGDASVARRYGGSGLGLSISRQICRLMLGDLLLQSERGKGSTFTARVKLGQVGERQSPTGMPESEEAPMHLPKRILVAEDNQLNRRLLEAYLQKLGHAVRFAHDGVEAVEACRDGAFDLILSDVQMPRMDGLTCARTIRAEEAEAGRPRTPIVAITAATTARDRQTCLDAGMDDFLTKPIRFNELRAILRRMLPEVYEESQSS